MSAVSLGTVGLYPTGGADPMGAEVGDGTGMGAKPGNSEERSGALTAQQLPARRHVEPGASCTSWPDAS